MLESGLEYRLDGRILHESSCICEGIRNPIVEADKHAALKPSLSKEPDFMSLFKSSLLSLLRRFRKFWLVDLKIQAFQALDTSDKL